MPLAGGPESLSEASPSSLYKIRKENKVRSKGVHARSPAPRDSRAAPPPREDRALVSPLTTSALGLVKACENHVYVNPGLSMLRARGLGALKN